MKKYISSILSLAAVMCFSACEDVPAPYELNTENNSSSEDSPVIYSEAFSSTLGECSNVIATGDYSWAIDYSCAKIAAFANNVNYESDAWLVTPQIDLSEVDSACVYFKYILMYPNASEVSTNYQLCISSDYDGDVTTATWTKLDYSPVAATAKDWSTWYECDYIDIPQSFMGGNVTIAFRYIAKSKAATWEVKDFIVYKGSHAKYSANSSNNSGESKVDENAEQLTIAEFISRADSVTVYQVTGIVGTIKQSTYGNYEITDETGSITIYGTLTSTGEAQKFASLGVEAGDTITLQGTYTLYNTTSEIKNAIYVNHKKGVSTAGESKVVDGAEQLTIDEFISRADANTIYQVTGTVGSIKNSTYGNYDITDETGTITIYGTLTSTGEAQKFESLGVKEGDKITLQGTYTLYNTTHEIKDAIYVSHESNGNGGGSEVEQGDVITLDFSANCFNITTDKTQDATTYSYGNLTCVCTGSSDAGFYFNSNDKYLMLGKQGATLTLSGFTGTVAKIEIVGTSKASEAVLQNIYVDDVAVSTETTGAKNVTNSYLIADDYRSAGSYTLKVNSKHNTQISKIIIYADAESSDVEPEVEEAPTYSFETSLPEGWTINNVTLPEGVTSVWAIDTKYSCAKGTGYANKTQNASEGWLISPSVNVSEGVFKFVECGNYFSSSENYAKYAAVKISTDGTNWTDLSLTREATGTVFTFKTTTADLSAYKGQSVKIAFVYTSDTEIAGTWEIQSVTLK
ncbi:MAG: choice-of-anchor J domain-containing protein [Marinilabiliaceae bacterium]|nr:choice-of-anchor J domain-containing protein [Marinilabiliaceae bacterium]